MPVLAALRTVSACCGIKSAMPMTSSTKDSVTETTKGLNEERLRKK